MGIKKNRNKECHCGSGKKYKHCHLKQEREEPIKIYELDNGLKESYSEKICMFSSELHDKCSQKIIKAHTISKSANLKKISVDGHVYSFKRSVEGLETNNGSFPIQKIGVNNASVFNGFCSKHDKELFAVIEDKELIFSDEQVFILTYRTIANELYLKYASQDHNIKAKDYDKGQPLNFSIFYQNLNNGFLKDGLDLAVRDLRWIKDIFDEKLRNKNFLDIRYYILVIDKTPEILNNTGWIPTYNFDGLSLANLDNRQEKFNILNVSTINYNGQGAIVFSWLDVDEMSNSYCIDFIKSFHNVDNKYKSSAVLQWLLNCAENIYWSINWWDNLSEEQKNKFSNEYMDVTQGKILHTYKRLFGFLDWKVIDIQTNISNLIV